MKLIRQKKKKKIGENMENNMEKYKIIAVQPNKDKTGKSLMLQGADGYAYELTYSDKGFNNDPNNMGYNINTEEEAEKTDKNLMLRFGVNYNDLDTLIGTEVEMFETGGRLYFEAFTPVSKDLTVLKNTSKGIIDSIQKGQFNIQIIVDINDEKYQLGGYGIVARVNNQYLPNKEMEIKKIQKLAEFSGVPINRDNFDSMIDKVNEELVGKEILVTKKSAFGKAYLEGSLVE